MLNAIGRLGIVVAVAACSTVVASSALGQGMDSTPVRPEDPVQRIARGLPTWNDDGTHYHFVLSYDGKRVRLLDGFISEGSPRSYLGQQPDLVVIVRGKGKKAIRRFNLPDPRKIRVWNIAPKARVRFREKPAGSLGKLREQTIQLRSVRFELLLPQRPGAVTVEFHRGSASGPLVGSIELATVR